VRGIDALMVDALSLMNPTLDASLSRKFGGRIIMVWRSRDLP